MLKNNGFHNRHSPFQRFTPLSLFSSGAQGVWYDPSDFATMFQDSSGLTPVTAVDQPVGLILDKSGNANSALQATPTSRPLLKIDSNGKYYLLCDGIDDSFGTSSINFTSTDRMSVFAGVRKLSDAARGMLAELSATSASPGSFTVDAPPAATATYRFGANGTSGVEAVATGFAAPVTNVLQISINLKGATPSAQVVARINAVAQSLSVAGSTGVAGNFGNYPLFIGRRNNSNLPFNGRIYSFIAVGKEVTPSELLSTENWVNGKTGAY